MKRILALLLLTCSIVFGQTGGPLTVNSSGQVSSPVSGLTFLTANTGPGVGPALSIATNVPGGLLALGSGSINQLGQPQTSTIPTGSIVVILGDSIQRSNGVNDNTPPGMWLSGLPAFANIPVYVYAIDGTVAGPVGTTNSGQFLMAAASPAYSKYLNGSLSTTGNASIASLYPSSPGNMYFIAAYGSNDLGGGTTFANFKSYESSIWTTAHGIGSRVIVIGVSIIGSQNTTTTQDSIWLWNLWLRGNGAYVQGGASAGYYDLFCDLNQFFVNFGGTSYSTGDTTWSIDGGHPTAAGQRVIALMEADAILQNKTIPNILGSTPQIPIYAAWVGNFSPGFIKTSAGSGGNGGSFNSAGGSAHDGGFWNSSSGNSGGAGGSFQSYSVGSGAGGNFSSFASGSGNGGSFLSYATGSNSGGSVDVHGDNTYLGGGVYFTGNNNFIQLSASSNKYVSFPIPTPSTDTAAYLGTAQTYTAFETFSGGIASGLKIGNSTNGTTTPSFMYLDGTYGTNADGAMGNLKLFLANNSTDLGLGVGNNFIEFHSGGWGGSSGGFAWYTSSAARIGKLTNAGNFSISGTINSASLTASTLIGTDGSKNIVSKTAGTDYSLITVQTGTLVGGTATKTVPSGCHPWVQDNASSLTNVGTLTVTVSGTTATITSTNVLDTSPFTLFNAGSQ